MRVSPDGARYLAMGAGKRVPWPFQLRVLAPWLAKTDAETWQMLARGSAVATLMCFAAYATNLGLEGWHVLAALVVAATLPGVFAVNLRLPVLVDLPAMSWALAATVAWQRDWWLAALVLVVVAGGVKETAPVFAAAWAWHPLLLVGLVTPLVVRLVVKPGPELVELREIEWIAEHPVRASRQFHAGRWLDGSLWLLPWGPALLGLGALSWPVVVSLALGYASTLVATDTVRLYQWAWPPLVVAAVGLVPVGWLVVVVMMAVWWPWRGDGI